MSNDGVTGLFRPLSAGSMTIPNRFAMAPMTRQASVGSVGLDTAFRDEGGRTLIGPASPDRVVAQFEAGEFDVVAIGRALLADPAWVNRLRDDTLDGFNGYDAQSALSTLH